MVRAGERREWGEATDPLEDLFGEFGVAAECGKFQVVEFAGLVEDQVRYAEFAEVVEQCGATDAGEAGFVVAERVGNSDCNFSDADRVAERPGTFRVDDVGEREGDAIEIGIGRIAGHFDGLAFGHDGAGIGAEHLRPECAVVAQLEHHVDQVWIEPASGAFDHDIAGGFDAEFAGEDFYGLGKAQDAGEE